MISVYKYYRAVSSKREKRYTLKDNADARLIRHKMAMTEFRLEIRRKLIIEE